ncbi:hypothetical protein [Dyella sp.]|uniref:hypothetical protein n=1 Tax=Dyella sp. TaxID=1869338 RepID=UPI002D79CD13|nr:hypothetical protein [Dyella sp.]HET7330431.1 hypothetical protein [Dyella sp.]
MNAITRTIVLFLLGTPVWAAAQAVHDAARISGSIFPTVVQPGPVAPSKPTPGLQPLEATQGVTSVCLASSDNAARCGTSAFCDVQAVGLSHCLARYATALVKRPDTATRTLSFTVRDAQGAASKVIVLATASQNDAQIAEAALDGKPGGNIVAMRMPSP